jgi:hypothetical protein
MARQANKRIRVFVIAVADHHPGQVELINSRGRPSDERARNSAGRLAGRNSSE